MEETPNYITEFTQVLKDQVTTKAFTEEYALNYLGKNSKTNFDYLLNTNVIKKVKSNQYKFV